MYSNYFGKVCVVARGGGYSCTFRDFFTAEATWGEKFVKLGLARGDVRINTRGLYVIKRETSTEQEEACLRPPPLKLKRSLSPYKTPSFLSVVHLFPYLIRLSARRLARFPRSWMATRRRRSSSATCPAWSSGTTRRAQVQIMAKLYCS